MRVINIIVSNNECPVISIDSFGIIDEQQSNEVVEQAEELFKDKCMDLKYGNKEMRDDCIKSGVFTLMGFDNYRDFLNDSLDDGYEEVAMHTVSIAWSSIDNVQL